MRQNKFLLVFSALVIHALLLSACGAVFPFPTPTPTLDIPALQTQAAQIFIAELTRNAPTATFTPSPTSTPTETPTSMPTKTPTITPTATITPDLATRYKTNILYFLAKDFPDNKKNKCTVEVVPIVSNQPKSGDIVSDVTNALQYLFAYKAATYGLDLINPLAASNFQVVSVEYFISVREVEIHLSGALVRTGKACDNGRMHDQIWSTVRQFEGVNSAVIWLNNSLLGDLLSGRD